jgi:serine/threonine-protein kinase
LREGYAANTVGHPSVVRVLQDGLTEDGAAFLVMELLDGELLEGRRKRLGGKLAAPEVVEYALQLLSVLEAAHGKGIIHRDIKPDNLFVEKDGRLRVLDFGVAQMRQVLAHDAERTTAGMLLGTPEFMPPEQVMGLRDEINPTSDIWAVGATMFMLLTGQHVHECETISQFLIAAASRPARTLGSVARDVPTPLCAVVDRALAFEKERRWQSARAMSDALMQVKSILGIKDSAVQKRGAPVPARPSPSQPESSARPAVPAAAPRPAAGAPPRATPPKAAPRPSPGKPPPPPPTPSTPMVPSDDFDAERTIAVPGASGSGLGQALRKGPASSARPTTDDATTVKGAEPLRAPDSHPGDDDEVTRVGTSPVDMMRGNGIDPFDVTTIAPGHLMPLGPLEDAEPYSGEIESADVLSDASVDEERTMAVPAPVRAPIPPRPSTPARSNPDDEEPQDAETRTMPVPAPADPRDAPMPPIPPAPSSARGAALRMPPMPTPLMVPQGRDGVPEPYRPPQASLPMPPMPPQYRQPLPSYGEGAPMAHGTPPQGYGSSPDMVGPQGYAPHGDPMGSGGYPAQQMQLAKAAALRDKRTFNIRAGQVPLPTAPTGPNRTVMVIIGVTAALVLGLVSAAIAWKLAPDPNMTTPAPARSSAPRR